MNKITTLFEQIVHKYHPDFKSPALLHQVRQHPRIFNIEHLIELTMAEVGGYKFIDAEHCDFDDGTECKTGSVSPNPVKFGYSSHRLEISNVISSGGKIKSGDIRIVLYNPVKGGVDYFYIPQYRLASIGINRHPTTKMGRIFASYNREKDYIPKLEPFRCKTFLEVATTTATKQFHNKSFLERVLA